LQAELNCSRDTLCQLTALAMQVTYGSFTE